MENLFCTELYNLQKFVGFFLGVVGGGEAEWHRKIKQKKQKTAACPQHWRIKIVC